MATNADSRPVAPDASRLDQLLDQFEQAWQSSSPPSLEAFIAGLAGMDPPLRRRLLVELIKIDLDHYWRSPAPGPGQADRPLLEAYARRFPELGSAAELPVSLVREEYWVRQCWGDRPTADEYLARFPGRAEALRAVLAEADAELSQEPGRAPTAGAPTP